MLTLPKKFKRCSGCRQTLPRTEFESAYDKARPNKVRSRCKACSRLKKRANKYGLTLDELKELLTQTECVICGDPAEHIDHCHTSGKVRAMLCGPCNQGLGNFKDDPDRLVAARNYLLCQNPPASQETPEMLP